MTRPDARSFDVLLAGYFGFSNLGDELLAEAAVDNLTIMGVSRERMAILTNNIDYTASRLGIKAFSRWNPASVLGALGTSRTLIFPGGGIFQDASSARSSVYYWSLIRTASMKRVPTGALAQSVGPLRGMLAKKLASDALSVCKYVSVRDSASVDVLSSMNLRCYVTPDPVLGFELPQTVSRETALVNMRPGCDGVYVIPVVKAANSMSASGMKITYVAMSGEDASFMRKLRDSGEIPDGGISEPKNAEDFSGIARKAAVAAGMRLHFGELSMLCGLDVLLSPYDPKVRSFAAEWNIGLLTESENNENFDIMRLLTNSRFGDKKKLTEVRSRIAADFKKALGRLLGEDDGFEKTRRT
ncbi:MAG: polysaccharide pyruvyl transferase family protein [Synergistaceae bacterium]|nr:polysaccharide pyruvyl transferase family protein [Synergistaceae bacterium]